MAGNKLRLAQNQSWEAGGGSSCGAVTYTELDGSRMPSALELELATIQGESFGQALNKVTFG